MPSEREKMLAGELYDPLDPELVAARDRARDLCQDLNATRESDQDARRRILSELFGEGGDDVWMQPPFFCDYGSNILLGERVFFNFNCVVLDVCPVRVGDFTLFGPAVQIYTATHPMNAELRRKQEFAKPVSIGSDVWVGGGAIICPGVTIGSRSVIGAGSVVTRDIPGRRVRRGQPVPSNSSPVGPFSLFPFSFFLFPLLCPEMQDLRAAIRALRSRPVMSAAAIVSLTLGDRGHNGDLFNPQQSSIEAPAGSRPR